MRHHNVVTMQFLCSRVQCGSTMQLRRSMNGPLEKEIFCTGVYMSYPFENKGVSPGNLTRKSLRNLFSSTT